MADAVTSRKLIDNETTLVYKFTNVSDGTGESGVVKVDVSALNANSAGQSCSEVAIDRIHGVVSGMEVQIHWDATATVVATLLGGNAAGAVHPVDFNFQHLGGLSNNAGAGKTGDIKFTTVGHATSDFYDLTVTMRKFYA